MAIQSLLVLVDPNYRSETVFRLGWGEGTVDEQPLGIEKFPTQWENFFIYLYLHIKIIK